MSTRPIGLYMGPTAPYIDPAQRAVYLVRSDGDKVEWTNRSTQDMYLFGFSLEWAQPVGGASIQTGQLWPWQESPSGTSRPYKVVTAGSTLSLTIKSDAAGGMSTSKYGLIRYRVATSDPTNQASSVLDWVIGDPFCVFE